MISLCPRRDDNFWEVERMKLIFKDQDGDGGSVGGGGDDGGGVDGHDDGS